jgi:hypothetical protein
METFLWEMLRKQATVTVYSNKICYDQVIDKKLYELSSQKQIFDIMVALNGELKDPSKPFWTVDFEDNGHGAFVASIVRYRNKNSSAYQPPAYVSSWETY